MPEITVVNGKDLKKNSITDSKSQHAEQILMRRATLPISFTIDAWPCVRVCGPLLKQLARAEKGGGNIVVDIVEPSYKGKLDYYATDWNLAAGALGRLTITPVLVTIESPIGTVKFSYANIADNDYKGGKL